MIDVESHDGDREVVTVAIRGRVFLMREGCVEAVEILPWAGGEDGLVTMDIYTDGGHVHSGLGPVTMDQAKKIAKFFLVRAIKGWADMEDGPKSPGLEGAS